MSDMNVRSDSVDVEQIMKQIRARVREKRGADYTESEIQQLAAVKLEKFLDPRGLRSDLIEQYRRNRQVRPKPPTYAFEDTTLYDTHRGLLRSIRNLFRPILKMFFNPDKITASFHTQLAINEQSEGRLRWLEEREPVSYELLHNLTVEVTRLGIEVHNLRMRIESVSSRLDFDERRGRSLETVVQYKPAALQRPAQTDPAPAPTAEGRGAATPRSAETPGQNVPGAAPGNGAESGERSRRRRRRRRRRPGQTLADSPNGGPSPQNGRIEPGDSADDADGDDDAPEGQDSNDQ
jgi:hypothetical protein